MIGFYYKGKKDFKNSFEIVFGIIEKEKKMENSISSPFGPKAVLSPIGLLLPLCDGPPEPSPVSPSHPRAMAQEPQPRALPPLFR
jgi:hypothetical protein